MNTIFFVLSQASRRCLKHALQEGLPCFPTVAAPACTIRGYTYYLCSSKLSHVRFRRVKVFRKQIWTCSDPYSIINKSCQACWPAPNIVLMTQPQLLDPGWLASGQLWMGSSHAQVAQQKATQRHSQGRQFRCPCASATQPAVPSGLFTKKKDAFNNVQPIFYKFNVVKVSCTSYLSIRLHSLSLYSLRQFVPDSRKPASIDPFLTEKGTKLLRQAEAYAILEESRGR